MDEQKTILEYDDLVNIPVRECGEPLVALQDATPEILCAYIKRDMIPLYGETMYARRCVAEKLREAQRLLAARRPDAKLNVAYAFRDITIQEKYFNARKNELRLRDSHADEAEIVRRAHLLSAAPDVAGHPTGGAIDITISGPQGDHDMGGVIGDFTDTDIIQTWYPHLTETQRTNRVLLREILMSVGFAPFNGEWWHFSYGDKEWAAYYEKPFAIYGPAYIKTPIT